jgi:predicted DNA-binding transcriptional regulator AlpA
MSVSKLTPGVGNGSGAVAKPPEVRDRQLTPRRLLHRKEAAHQLGVSLSWLDKARLTGRGPVFIKIGDAIRYAAEDLDKFIAANRRTSTSQ